MGVRKINERTDSAGNVLERAEMVNGLRDGITTYFDPSGQALCEIIYKKGKINGTITRWNFSGIKVLEAEIESGQYHGTYRSWWDNGAPKEVGCFSRNNRVGVYRWYDEKGKQIKEHDYGGRSSNPG